MVDVEIDAWAEKGDGPRTYNAPDCLFPTESDEDNDYLVQGITAGWADVYEWYLPDRYIRSPACRTASTCSRRSSTPTTRSSRPTNRTIAPPC